MHNFRGKSVEVDMRIVKIKYLACLVLLTTSDPCYYLLFMEFSCFVNALSRLPWSGLF